MLNIKRLLLIPMVAIACLFTRIDSAHAVDYPFSVTTSSIDANGTFEFVLSAKGTFYVDCGDGGSLSSDNSTANGMISVGTITKTDTTKYTFKCTYSTTGEKTIRFGGTATAYNTGSSVPAISFCITVINIGNPLLISSISGDLSAVFPNNGTALGKHPVFYRTFNYARNLTSIPATLFASYRSGGSYMFYGTFCNCTSLTSIPETLFNFGGNNVSGQQSMFSQTFLGCSGLTSIPANLFQRVSSAAGLFNGTFSGCSGLTSIPVNLFQRVTSGAINLFNETFSGCSGLTSIPETLFNFGGNNVSGNQYMFTGTFTNCGGLTSIPANLFQRVTSSATYMFNNTFRGCTGLTSIPETLFNFGGNNVSGQQSMFSQTFMECIGLTSIPANLFQRVTSGAQYLFRNTFAYCTNITGYIPSSTFAGLIANSSPTANYMWQDTFKNTQLVTECPTGTHQYTTGYEGTDTSKYTKWNGYVSCEPGIKLTWDGSSGTPASCTYGGTFTPPTPTRPGYIFTGWKVKTINP